MDIWEPLIVLANQLETKFDLVSNRYTEENMDRFNYSGWKNITWKSERFRRIHIDIVDTRELKKLWMMHVCIFPHLDSGAPVYGFDIISGPKKITGAFHDFSPINPDHNALDYFTTEIAKTEWKKERELPLWAKAIFSESMLAAGNVQTEQEVLQLCSLVHKTTDWYLEHMDLGQKFDSKNAQNRYAAFQKQNPHTPKTMKSLGLDEEDVDFFVSKCLFPEIE